MVGRKLCWSLELSKFDVRYEGRKALKAQALYDFVAEMTFTESLVSNAQKLVIYMDGASSSTVSGTRIILENREGKIIEVSLSLSFPTSNNQVEYEDFLADL